MLMLMMFRTYTMIGISPRRSIFDQCFLDVENLLRDVVHENTKLQYRIRELEFNREYVPLPIVQSNTPLVAEHQVATSAQRG